jgi:parvulin-like peptidyl-prolyl isomerase
MTSRHTVAHPTRKHLARAERDRRIRISLLAGTGVILLAVFGLLGYGWYDSHVIQPRQPVAEVNGEIITGGAFHSRVLFAQRDLLAQYQNYQQLLSFLGSDPQSLQSIQTQLDRLQTQLADPQVLGQSLLDQMVAEVLIQQEAENRGIEVSQADIDRALEESAGFYAEGTPTPQPVPTATAGEPTREPSPSATSEPAAVAPTATSQAEVVQPEVGLEETVDPNATPLPTATVYTREVYQANYDAYITSLRAAGIDEGTVQAVWRAQLYRERLRETFADQVPKEQEQVWARHILVADQAQAQELLGRIQAGESWEALAAEFSEDSSNKDQGGDLGWFGRGIMVEPFEQAAFAGAVGEVVGPVETDFGWHLIEILGHEVRPLDPDRYDSELSRVFNEWLDQAREQADVVIHDTWMERLPPAPLSAS